MFCTRAKLAECDEVRLHVRFCLSSLPSPSLISRYHQPRSWPIEYMEYQGTCGMLERAAHNVFLRSRHTPRVASDTRGCAPTIEYWPGRTRQHQDPRADAWMDPRKAAPISFP